MRLELSDGLSNNSDFSSDSQNSQMSTADFMASMGNGNLVFTPTSFITLDGLNSGVPTRTTPTLTPTSLRNIEQTFIELQCEAERHQNEAGFVPPLVHPIGNNQYISASDVDLHSNKSNSWHSSSDSSRPTPPTTPASLNDVPTTTTRRNMGGRKPTKHQNLSPEDEEKRRVRRERNKMAAARCRKRRVDHTNTLLEEVEGLEAKKQALQTEIQQLNADKEELEFILEHHSASSCRLMTSRPTSPPDVKPYLYEEVRRNNGNNNSRVKTEFNEDQFCLPADKRELPLMSSTIPISRPSRPSSLNFGATFPSHKSAEEIAGMPITTPSNGIPFNFESMMVGGTGLTPVAGPMIPSCSTQQRNLPPNVDLSSPDANGPPKLVSL